MLRRGELAKVCRIPQFFHGLEQGILKEHESAGLLAYTLHLSAREREKEREREREREREEKV